MEMGPGHWECDLEKGILVPIPFLLSVSWQVCAEQLSFFLPLHQVLLPQNQPTVD